MVWKKFRGAGSASAMLVREQLGNMGSKAISANAVIVLNRKETLAHFTFTGSQPERRKQREELELAINKKLLGDWHNSTMVSKDHNGLLPDEWGLSYCGIGVIKEKMKAHQGACGKCQRHRDRVKDDTSMVWGQGVGGAKNDHMEDTMRRARLENDNARVTIKTKPLTTQPEGNLYKIVEASPRPTLKEFQETVENLKDKMEDFQRDFEATLEMEHKLNKQVEVLVEFAETFSEILVKKHKRLSELESVIAKAEAEKKQLLGE